MKRGDCSEECFEDSVGIVVDPVESGFGTESDLFYFEICVIWADFSDLPRLRFEHPIRRSAVAPFEPHSSLTFADPDSSVEDVGSQYRNI